MNVKVLQEIVEEVEGAFRDARLDNPDANEDDVYHDIAQSLCWQRWYDGQKAEVRAFMRQQFGLHPSDWGLK